MYHEGVLVAQDGKYVGPVRARRAAPASAVRLPPGLSEASLRITATTGRQAVRVIQMFPDQIVTGELREEAAVRDGAMASDTVRDLLKLAVIERHRGSGNIGLGFVRGFELKRGALASTVGHDAHNLAVVGTNDADMILAARTLAACGGGQCAVAGGKVLALLPLPIAGLLSDQAAPVLIAQQRALTAAAKEMGYPHGDAFMPLSFLVLPVIPKLKLTDRGLVDVGRFEVVPLKDEGVSLPDGN